MTPERVTERYLIAAAPLVKLPGRNKSVEYNHVPKMVADYLERAPVVYIQDPAGFVDPRKLAQDVVQRVSMRFMLESRDAERKLNGPWASAMAEMAKEAEERLNVIVEPVTSPKSGEKGWRVTARPDLRSFWQKAEYLARGEG